MTSVEAPGWAGAPVAAAGDPAEAPGPGDLAEVVVVVPARDEEELLDACLAALARAAEQVQLPVRTVVVLDRCADGSAGIAANRPDVEVVSSSFGAAGAARRLGFWHAVRASAAAPAKTWLASTDADSRVPMGWLVHQLQLAAAGADLVLGTVALDPDGSAPELHRVWSAGYDARDGHRHVHAANLGVRADVYLAAGGFPAVATHEDASLAAAVTRLGARVVRSAGSPVLTSARLAGRAPAGFAAYLDALTRDGPRGESSGGAGGSARFEGRQSGRGRRVR